MQLTVFFSYMGNFGLGFGILCDKAVKCLTGMKLA